MHCLFSEKNIRSAKSLTEDREAGCGALGAVRVGVELAGVARLVLGPDPLYGQFGFPQRAAQPDPTFELLLRVRAMLGVRGDGGGVALLGRLPPQNLVDALAEAVGTVQGDRPPAYGRPVAP